MDRLKYITWNVCRGMNWANRMICYSRDVMSTCPDKVGFMRWYVLAHTNGFRAAMRLNTNGAERCCVDVVGLRVYR